MIACVYIMYVIIWYYVYCLYANNDVVVLRNAVYIIYGYMLVLCIHIMGICVSMFVRMYMDVYII